ncbi:MAG TPA: hypothetical protein VJS12_22960 [Steroidobacteraceae bacterium]|nr:hypothetical protein [Steroidobacteraceae bacterium]
MIKTLLIGHLILALLFIAWLAPRPWRIALGCLFSGCQLLILTFGLEFDAHEVLAAEARSGFRTPSWEVVRKVRDAHNLDRLCAGVAGLGLFVLVVHRRRPRAIDTACDSKRSQ